MKLRLLLGLLSAALTFTSHAAPDAPAPGQKLSREQIAQWGDLPVYQVGKNKLRVLPTGSADNQQTLLINAQGVVGVSRNTIAISGVSAQAAQNRLRQVVPQPLSIKYFEQAGVTVARYADFSQAVAGLKAAQAALPEAQVRLPVKFGQQVPY